VSERKPPEPIKPRRLLRRPNAIYGSDYFTSDGRYEVYPLYKDRPNGGRTNKVDQWVIKDLKDPEWTRYYPLLDDIRRYYCAPDGNVPWLVCDMDDGIVRAELSRAAIVEWACNHHMGKVISRTGDGNSWYEYQIGDSREDSTMVWICRADEIHWHGFDPVQEPWYPYPDDPHEVGPRALRTHDERLQ
jgi:hypothetical protein